MVAIHADALGRAARGGGGLGLARDEHAAGCARRGLRLGLFGLGRTADAVLAAGGGAHAIVAAGGSHSASLDSLAELVAPTMVIVGGEDRAGVRAARAIGERLGAPVRYVAVVAGATRAFAEPGALEQVANLAGSWFARHLSAEAS